MGPEESFASRNGTSLARVGGTHGSRMATSASLALYGLTWGPDESPYCRK